MKTTLLGFTALVCTILVISAYPHTNVVATVVHDTWQDEVSYAGTKEYPIRAATTSVPASLLFVGDIMLARAVESRMKQLGIEYPFESLGDVLASPDITIGNFEGVVSKVHYHTPNYTFQFSVEPLYLEYLKTVGFDILSLANNHSLDYGTTSLSYTRALCVAYGLICGGEPEGLSEMSTEVVEIDGYRVGILFINTIFDTPDINSLITTLDTLHNASDIQIAYVHWGEEYALMHNVAQEVLAKTLIDNGIDVVIGHHPHVVQDVDMYDGKPIFYSLGNFVFDQFFSNDVQEMLGVHMKINDRDIVYTLLPFSSIDTHSQPHHADTLTARALRERILATLREDSRVNVDLGTITVLR